MSGTNLNQPSRNYSHTPVTTNSSPQAPLRARVRWATLALLIACATLLCTTQASATPNEVVVSVKRVLDANGQRPTGYYGSDSAIRAAINTSNTILDVNAATFRLALDEIVDVSGMSQYYDTLKDDKHDFETLVKQSSSLGWRNDAINIYVVNTLDAGGVCSFPTAHEIILINSQGLLNWGAGWLHEIGHYLSLTHTHECCHDSSSSCPGTTCTKAGASHDGSCSGIELCDDLCDTSLNVMSYNPFPPSFGQLTPCQLGHMDQELYGGSRSHVTRLCRQRIQASDMAQHAYFGGSVAIDGDYAIVGARQHNNAVGAAYVFQRDGDMWVEIQKLTSPTTSPVNFGISVDIDGNSAIVGTNGGGAYIYTEIGGTWVMTNTLQMAGANLSGMGRSVAIDGAAAVIGAPFFDTGAADVGAAYVYTNFTGSWLFEGLLLAPLPSANGNFGEDVAISGGFIAVSRPNDDERGVDAGAVFVYQVHLSFGLNFIQKLTASDAAAGDQFGGGGFSPSGATIALDGFRLIVGAPEKDTLFPRSGAVYVFDYVPGGSWTESHKLEPQDIQYGAQFGNAVAVSDDQVLVGAILTDDGAINSGSTYVFQDHNGHLAEWAKLTHTDPQDFDRMGAAVAIDEGRVLSAVSRDDNETGSVDIRECIEPTFAAPVYDLQCTVTGSEVTLSWVNAAPYESIQIFEDGLLIDEVEGSAELLVFDSATAGSHTYGVSAQVGALSSEEMECTLAVAPPVCDAVSDFSCETVGTQISMTWQNNGNYNSIEIWDTLNLIATLPGDATSFELDAGPGFYVFDIITFCTGSQNFGGCALLHEPLVQFQRSDCNGDGSLNIADAVFLLTFLAGGNQTPPCFDACDTNDDGLLNIADVIRQLYYLNTTGVPIPAPFGTCGQDPTDDALDCSMSTACP